MGRREVSIILVYKDKPNLYVGTHMNTEEFLATFRTGQHDGRPLAAVIIPGDEVKPDYRIDLL